MLDYAYLKSILHLYCDKSLNRQSGLDFSTFNGYLFSGPHILLAPISLHISWRNELKQKRLRTLITPLMFDTTDKSCNSSLVDDALDGTVRTSNREVLGASRSEDSSLSPSAALGGSSVRSPVGESSPDKGKIGKKKGRKQVDKPKKGFGRLRLRGEEAFDVGSLDGPEVQN